MTTNHRHNRIFIVAGCLLLAATPALAGKITGFTTFGSEDGTGPGLGSVLIAGIVHSTDNNDNQTGGGPEDNNISVPIKKFEHNGYIDIEFHVASTGGVSEYSISEFVDNNVVPFASWSKFAMYLGFGVNTDFVLSPAGDELDFDYDTFDFPPTSTAFSQVATSQDQLVFYNGSHFTGAQEYTLRIDVPDGLPNGMFTLRQVPIVPEPSSLVLGTLSEQSPGGPYQIDSFFDVFTELSLDGGQNWIPASGPIRMDLTRVGVPEPASLSLAAVVGLIGLAVRLRRRWS